MVELKTYYISFNRLSDLNTEDDLSDISSAYKPKPKQPDDLLADLDHFSYQVYATFVICLKLNIRAFRFVSIRIIDAQDDW